MAYTHTQFYTDLATYVATRKATLENVNGNESIREDELLRLEKFIADNPIV